jgi:predicted PurR-regulated permease PerM
MKETTTISISTGTIIKTLASITVFAGIFYVSDFLIALLVSVVLASAVEMPVRFFAKWGVPRSVSVLPPLADDIALFIKTLPKILESIRIFGRDMGFKDLSVSLQDLSRDISKGQILTILKTSFFGASGFFATTSAVVGKVINLVLTFVLAFYLALEEHGVQKFLRWLFLNIRRSTLQIFGEEHKERLAFGCKGNSSSRFLLRFLYIFLHLF